MHQLPRHDANAAVAEVSGHSDDEVRAAVGAVLGAVAYVTHCQRIASLRTCGAGRRWKDQRLVGVGFVVAAVGLGAEQL